MSRGTARRGRGGQFAGDYNLRSAQKKLEETLDSVSVQTADAVTDKMAAGFESRDDPEYIKFMEDEVIKSRQSREEETKLLNSLVARMDKWDTKQAGVQGVGRGILRTPLRSGPPPGQHGGAGVGRGSSPLDSLTGHPSFDMSRAADPAPSDIINGPLTSVLQQLSVAIDPTPQTSTKGLLLRPEYYVQHKDKGVPVKSLDHSKLTFRELMSGMSRVMLHLAKTGGNVTSYMEHFSFLTRKAGAHGFMDSAYVAYDRHVVDQFINGDSEGFVAGDMFGIALHFHAGNLLLSKPVFKPNRGRGFRRGGRSNWYDYDKQPGPERDQREAPNPPLDGFPDDICYKFNYRICTGKCSKLHVCRACRGNHKASSGQCPTGPK